MSVGQGQISVVGTTQVKLRQESHQRPLRVEVTDSPTGYAWYVWGICVALLAAASLLRDIRDELRVANCIATASAPRQCMSEVQP